MKYVSLSEYNAMVEALRESMDYYNQSAGFQQSFDAKVDGVMASKGIAVISGEDSDDANKDDNKGKDEDDETKDDDETKAHKDDDEDDDDDDEQNMDDRNDGHPYSLDDELEL